MQTGDRTPAAGAAAAAGSPARATRAYPRRGLHGRVADEIGARILAGEFTPGDVLPSEAAFSTSLRVSRTALREAIKVLAAKGLLESRPRTGTRVRPRDSWNMLDPDVLAWQIGTGPVGGGPSGDGDPAAVRRAGEVARFTANLFEVRRIVEPAAAALAAARATPDDVAAIARAYDDLAATVDGPDSSIEPDLRFHAAILAATGNELLVPLGSLIETALAVSIRISSAQPGALAATLPRHKEVLDAIRDRDKEQARLAMHRLLDRTVEDIDRALGGPAAGPAPARPASPRPAPQEAS